MAPRPADGAAPAAARLRYGAAAISAALLAAAHPPVALRPLAFVALAPWFAVLLRDRGRGHLGPAYVFGLLHFTLGLSWLFPLHPAFPPALSLILALYPLLFAALMRPVARLGPAAAAWALPAVWLSVDFLRERALSGFGYLFPGLALAGSSLLRQGADLGGVPLLTLLLLLSNVATAAWLLRRYGARAPSEESPPGPPFPALAMTAGTLLAVLAGYGAVRRGPPPGDDGLRVLLVQPAFPLGLKAEAVRGGNPSGQRMFDEGAALTVRGLRDRPDTDVVIWAETMIPSVLVRPRTAGGAFDERSAALLAAVAGLPHHAGTPGARFLGGALVRDPDGEMRNAVLLLEPDGGVAARFDKVHLTPFGEYLPLIDALPASLRDGVLGVVARISPFVPRLLPGTSGGMALRGERSGTMTAGGLICYEAIFPAESRARVAAGADFLLVPANYGWYGRWMQGQTLDILRMRAVEARRPVVSPTNDGPTAVLDGDGGVVASLPAGERGVLHATVARDGRSSVYVATGDLIPWTCVVAAGAALVAGLRRRRGDIGNLLTPSAGAP